jgi:hypothetical protein
MSNFYDNELKDEISFGQKIRPQKLGADDIVTKTCFF